MGIFRKASAVKRRLKKVRKELSLVDSDIRSLSRTLERKAEGEPRLRSQFSAELREKMRRTERVDSGGRKPLGGKTASSESAPSRHAAGAPADRMSHPALRDERFASYLASSLQPTKALRGERRSQRNKAIIMLLVVLVVLFWVLFKFLL